jgi:hypothetical protein
VAFFGDNRNQLAPAFIFSSLTPPKRGQLDRDAFSNRRIPQEAPHVSAFLKKQNKKEKKKKKKKKRARLTLPALDYQSPRSCEMAQDEKEADELFFAPQTSRRKPPPLYIPLSTIPERTPDTTVAAGGAPAPLNIVIGDSRRLPFFSKKQKVQVFWSAKWGGSGSGPVQLKGCRDSRTVLGFLFLSFFFFSLFLSRPLFWAAVFHPHRKLLTDTDRRM